LHSHPQPTIFLYDQRKAVIAVSGDALMKASYSNWLLKVVSVTLGAGLTIAAIMCTFPAWAQDRTVECKAVFNKATITLSGKLLLGISEDPNQKTCEFIVAMPPPHGTSTAANAWYAVKASDAVDPKYATKIVADLAVSLISEQSKQYTKTILGKIFDNAKLTTACFSALIKKSEIALKSADGQFVCSVPPSGDQAVIRVSAENSFTVMIILPRPV
jgi:hypothetical protein